MWVIPYLRASQLKLFVAMGGIHDTVVLAIGQLGKRPEIDDEDGVYSSSLGMGVQIFFNAFDKFGFLARHS